MIENLNNFLKNIYYEGLLSGFDINKNEPFFIDINSFVSGKISNNIIEQFSKHISNCYQEELFTSEIIDCFFIPYILKHGDKLITPFLINVNLSKHGKINFKKNSNEASIFVPTTFLDPFAENYSFGTYIDYDKFLRNVSVHLKFDNISQFVKKIFKELNDCDIENIPNYELYRNNDGVIMSGIIPIRESTIPLFTNIYRHYLDKSIVTNKPFYELLNPQKKPKIISNTLNPLDLGRMPNDFSFNKDQIKAINNFIQLENGCVQVIEGDSFTGKTTVIKGIISNIVVNSAITETVKPIMIIAPSETMAKEIATEFDIVGNFGAENIFKRWIPDIESFGILYQKEYLQEKNKKHKFITIGLNEEQEISEFYTEDYLQWSKTCFLAKLNDSFAYEAKSITEARDFVHRQLLSHIETYKNGCKIYQELSADNKELLEQYGENIKENLNDKIKRIREEINEIKKNNHFLNNLKNDLLKILLKRSKGINNIFFNKNKFSLICKDFLSKKNMQNPELVSPKDIENYFLSVQSNNNFKIQQLNEELALVDKYLSQETNFKKWLGINDSNYSDIIDTKTRHSIFWLAIHYWEARWIEESFDSVESFKKSNFNKNIIDKLDKYLKLSPCIVTTPDVAARITLSISNGSWKPQFGIFDTIITDNSEQILPEEIIPVLYTANKVVVVGNHVKTKKIRKINNLALEEILKQLKLNNHYLNINSLLDISKQSTFFRTHLKQEYKTNNIYNNIVRIINNEEGVYTKEKAFLPVITHAHIKSLPTKKTIITGTYTEQESIINWLSRNKSAIESHYKDKLNNIAIIWTPFLSQKINIKKALKKNELTVDVTNNINTYHKIIICSLSINEAFKNIFFNRESCLKTILQKAEDSIIVFGNIETLCSTESGSFLNKLGNACLINNIPTISNYLQTAFIDGTKAHFSSIGCGEKEYEEHIKYIASKCKKTLTITTPFINNETINKISMFRSFIPSNITIHIYYSKHLENNKLIENLNNLNTKCYQTFGRYCHNELITDDGIYGIGTALILTNKIKENDVIQVFEEDEGIAMVNMNLAELNKKKEK